MVSLTIISLVFSALSLSGGEVIKFEDKNNILCVTDNADSILYLNPPVVKKTRNSSVLVENDKIWNDWSLKSSMEVYVPPALDKRWEDLATTYTDSVDFEAVSYVVISVPSGINLTSSASDVSPSFQKKTRDGSMSWVTWFTTINNENTTEPTPYQMNVTSSEKTYFRVHDYKLRWANTVSKTVTTLPVSTNDTSCLMMYAYICPHCFLNFKVTGGTIQTFSGQKQRASETWQSRRIHLVSNEVTIELYRNTTGGKDKGRWAVDFRRCPPTVANKTIYEVALDDDVERVERKCILGAVVPAQNNRPSADVRINNDAFSCEPGTIGRDCDIQCSELFGAEEKYCEQHKICDNTDLDPQCVCSWGYEGDTCNKTCSEGKWGLSCQSKCSSCDSCKATTGECSSSPTNFRIASGLFLLAIMLKFL